MSELSPMKIARMQQGMTQLELSRRVGVTESKITKIETGRFMPDEALRRRIAAALGIHSYQVRGEY